MKKEKSGSSLGNFAQPEGRRRIPTLRGVRREGESMFYVPSIPSQEERKQAKKEIFVELRNSKQKR